MEDPTSPVPTNASEVVWPTPAVPGQGIPRRNGDRDRDRTESRSPASTGVPVGNRNSPSSENAQVSALESGPAEPDIGDRAETSGPPVPESGPGVPNEREAPRAGGEDHGPHVSSGTVVADGGAGTGNPAGASDETADEGAALLHDLRAAIGRYVVLPSDEALTAVTLWVAASHIQPALQHAPRLAVVGPTKGCGKSRVLDVLHETVHQPMMTVNTSPAVVFRVIGQNPPTLLVDEADTIFGPKAGDKEDLRGLLNAGHQRNRPAWRISGPEHKPTAFPTFAMAALAGIGDLPDTIMDRAVVLRMQKRKPGERIAPFRSRYSVPELNALRDRLTAWLAPLRSTAGGLVPRMPVEDRAADTWEPLVIIAELAGRQWPSWARAACLAMTRNEVVQDEQTTLKTRLLRDIRRVFEQQGDTGAMRSHDLLAALVQDPEAPWAEYGTKGLNAYHLANLLRDFGVSPANHRFENGRQAKAYARNQFVDAWARYCPAPDAPVPAAGESVLARRIQGKPPIPPTGTPPVGPPGGPSGPRRTR